MRTLAPGSVISHYRIQELIAPGGMGEVYKAIDLSLGRKVAIKIPNPQIASDPKAKNDFLREAHAASRLTHPNICTIYEVGEEDGLPFIVMAYIAGTTLRDLIRRASLGAETIIQLAAQIADALSDAHRHGVVHRDLKPSNIMVNSRGQAILLDFGLAKLLNSADESCGDLPTLQQTLTKGEIIKGTVAYMSPEQVRALDLDGRSDIFSFGIVLFEMLCGQRPFKGGSDFDLMQAILHQEPPSLREYQQGVGASLAAVIRRALEKDPSARYQTAGELKEDLQAIANSGGVDISQAMTTEMALTPRLASASRNSGSSWRQHLQAPRVWLMGGMATLLLLTLAKMVWSPTLPFGTTTFAPMKVMPPLERWKTEIGDRDSTFPRLSPDGRSIVYSTTKNGAGDLWLKSLDGNDAEPIAITKDQWFDTTPIFSADGEEVAYLSYRDGKWGAWKVSARGGASSILGMIEGRSPNLVAWSKDGQQVYYEEAGNLHVLGVFDHATKPVTSFTPYKNKQFRLSPDERRVVFVREAEGEHSDIWFQDLDGSNARRLTNDEDIELNPIWHPEGDRVLYHSMHGEITQVRLVYLDGRPPVQLTSGELDTCIADISFDGTRILFESSDKEADLWMTDSLTGSTRKLISEVGIETWPEVSSLGTLAYQAIQHGNVERNFYSSKLHLLQPALPEVGKSNASAATLIGDGYEPRWSPDGHKLAFLRGEEDTSLWVKSSDSGDPHQLSKSNVYFSSYTLNLCQRYDGFDFDWAPDSRWIAYTAIQSEITNIIAASTEGGETIQLTNNDSDRYWLQEPTWSPDGKRLAYVRVSYYQKSKTFSVWLNEGGTDTHLHDSPTPIRLLGWNSDGSEVFFVTLVRGDEHLTAPKPVAFWRKPVAGGLARQIASQEGVNFHNLRLSPDRRQIAYVIRKGAFDCLAILTVDTGQTHCIYLMDEQQSYLTSITWTPDGKSLVWSKFTNTRSIGTIERTK
jgi:serine/threonine protein kinase/Tol biopolymer transport system component